MAHNLRRRGQTRASSNGKTRDTHGVVLRSHDVRARPHVTGRKRKHASSASSSASCRSKRTTGHWLALFDSAEKGALVQQWTEALEGSMQCKTQRLPCGDIWLLYCSPGEDGQEQQELWLAVERKTPSDLYSSILDGRYRDQCERMAALQARHKCVLLVGPPLHAFDALAQHTREPARRCVLTAFNRFSIHHAQLHANFVDSDADVPYYLRKMMEVFNDKRRSAQTGTPDVFVDHATIAASCGKRRAETAPQFFVSMLSTIKGVSAATAAAIARQYPEGLFDLLQTYHACDSESQRDKLLQDIDVSKEGAPFKRLGPAMSTRIHRLLFQTNDTSPSTPALTP